MDKETRKLLIALIVWIIQAIVSETVIAQSIGYHHNMNLGFNPYLSPVFGYGLGLPYGSYTHGAIKNPLLANSILAMSFNQGYNLFDRYHTKNILKKISSPFGQKLNKGSIMNKLAIIKNPEYSNTPYGLDYGYGRHYGAAVIPNNPYKSAYGDHFYDMQPTAWTNSKFNPHQENFVHPIDPGLDVKSLKLKSLVKPLIKVGAVLATASLLGKKTIDIPSKLNPSGMILSGERMIVSRK